VRFEKSGVCHFVVNNKQQGCGFQKTIFCYDSIHPIHPIHPIQFIQIIQITKMSAPASTSSGSVTYSEEISGFPVFNLVHASGKASAKVS